MRQGRSRQRSRCLLSIVPGTPECLSTACPQDGKRDVLLDEREAGVLQARSRIDLACMRRAVLVKALRLHVLTT